jgi:hypothetical protein
MASRELLTNAIHPVTTALSFFQGTLSNALITSAVPFTEMDAPYTGELASGCEPWKV